MGFEPTANGRPLSRERFLQWESFTVATFNTRQKPCKYIKPSCKAKPKQGLNPQLKESCLISLTAKQSTCKVKGS